MKTLIKNRRVVTAVDDQHSIFEIIKQQSANTSAKFTLQIEVKCKYNQVLLDLA